MICQMIEALAIMIWKYILLFTLFFSITYTARAEGQENLYFNEETNIVLEDIRNSNNRDFAAANFHGLNIMFQILSPIDCDPWNEDCTLLVYCSKLKMADGPARKSCNSYSPEFLMIIRGKYQDVDIELSVENCIISIKDFCLR